MKLQLSSELFMQLLDCGWSSYKDLILLKKHRRWRYERISFLCCRWAKSLFFLESGTHHVLAHSLFMLTSKCWAEKYIIIILRDPWHKVVCKCDILWVNLLIGNRCLWLEVICFPILKGLFLIQHALSELCSSRKDWLKLIHLERLSIGLRLHLFYNYSKLE